jgi:hypothetical protein
MALPVAAAALVTGSVVGVSIARSVSVDRGATQILSADATVAPRVLASGDSPFLRDRHREFSRSAKRVTLKKKPAVKDHLFRTANLNLWPAAAEKGKPLKVLQKGGKVAVTGVRRAGFAQILYDGQVRWVNADYLAHTMPVAPKPASPPAAPTPGSSASASGSSASTGGGVTSAPCPDGSGTESGLTSSAVRLFRSACNAFPAFTSYGGWDAHGEHSSGKAIDFMTSDPALGQALADWARAHASELDLYDIIWQQHIWTPARSGEGWRAMPDRGSATANHFDHVHISVN